jgi:hypothetical protein
LRYRPLLASNQKRLRQFRELLLLRKFLLICTDSSTNKKQYGLLYRRDVLALQDRARCVRLLHSHPLLPMPLLLRLPIYQ